MSFTTYLDALNSKIEDIKPVKLSGRVVSVKGLVIEARGISGFVSIGSRCRIKNNLQDSYILCEVVGFDVDSVLLMPFEDTEGVASGAEIEIDQHENAIYPDDKWLGRVINAFAEPIDELGPLKSGQKAYPLKTSPPPPHKRQRIGKKIDLGVKAIDSFVSCCYGQRMGIFAGSGVGKSVLISMLTKYADTDVKVIGLIGERGREAKEFIEEYLGEEGLKKAVVILATGNESALLRKRAAYVTMAIAEYFRDQGKEVLCIMDSVTRFAMAQREIGLAVGEPPTTKGYTPSVFSELPKLLERAGPGLESANITGLFTVLVEGDDHNEPISDAVRGILDGHIVLDRAIAERGRFPAVDVLRSVSRTLPRCNNDLENKQITYARRMLATYHDMAEMIRLGAYKQGTDREVDLSIGYFEQIEEFLNQKPDESCSMEESYKRLGAILNITE
ncbi:MAG: flagellum-specific ATP synthase FliI [Rickettsiales bacterium]|nr:MAG: flagellum-specific ATP synthase FliI [Rickettsiales bacterium]